MFNLFLELALRDDSNKWSNGAGTVYQEMIVNRKNKHNLRAQI